MDTLCSLADLCRYNPLITVKYRVVGFGPRNKAWPSPSDICILPVVILGNMFVEVTRKDASNVVWPVGVSDWVRRLAVDLIASGGWKRPNNRDAARLDVPNLRFFPMEDLLVEGLFEEHGKFYQDAAQTQSLVPLYERIIRGWLKDGF
jgi:hypothetical protein